MRILLDTHAFLWYSTDRLQEFSYDSRGAFLDDSGDLLLSSVSITEMAIKYATGDLDITSADVRLAMEEINVTILPYSHHHSLRLYGLPLHHRDPFDRMLIATALSEDIAFMSRDRHVGAYKDVGLRVIW